MSQSIHASVALARQRLRKSGIPDDEADLDARLLAETVLGWDTAHLLAAANETAPPQFEESYGTLVGRRASREPIAYIIGRQEFWGLTFEVSPAVLIPRPETELIVETMLELAPEPRTPLRVADICTGSGCIAVAIARERQAARFVAVDLSGEALEVATRNAVAHGVANRIEFRQADLLQGLTVSFDLLVSNPPYVAEADRETIQPEVREHEPGLALFAGPDGLAVIRRLLADAARVLGPNGFLIFEFGFGQADAINRLIADAPRLALVGIRKDLQGIPRVAVAQLHT